MCKKYRQSANASESKDKTNTEDYQKNFNPFMHSHFFLEGLLACDYKSDEVYNNYQQVKCLKKN